MQIEKLKNYLNHYEGLNKTWRIDNWLITSKDKNLNTELAEIGYKYSCEQKYYKKAEDYIKI
jgi:hypothetical protein